MRALIPLAALCLYVPAFGQTGAAGPLERLRYLDPATVRPADCDAQVEQATTRNGPDLFYGAAVCRAANRPVESNFLLNAAQTRSIVDMTLIVPATRADSEVQTQIYGFIYFSAGGPGDENVLRDPASRDRFFDLLDSWSPAYGPEYNPGWNARRRPDAPAYRAAIEGVKEGRRRQLAEIATLYADDVYFSLHRRFQELQARNSNRYVEGSTEANLARDLERQMAERAATLGIADRRIPDEGVPSEARFPPAIPAAEETLVAGGDDPVIRHCSDIAERHTIAVGSAVVRVLVTRSPEWGTIWRADIEGGDDPSTRFTCTETTSSSRPTDGPGDAIPPLD